MTQIITRRCWQLRRRGQRCRALGGVQGDQCGGVPRHHVLLLGPDRLGRRGGRDGAVALAQRYLRIKRDFFFYIIKHTTAHRALRRSHAQMLHIPVPGTGWAPWGGRLRWWGGGASIDVVERARPQARPKPRLPEEGELQPDKCALDEVLASFRCGREHAAEEARAVCVRGRRRSRVHADVFQNYGRWRLFRQSGGCAVDNVLHQSKHVVSSRYSCMLRW